jgi:hypothetical protein
MHGLHDERLSDVTLVKEVAAGWRRNPAGGFSGPQEGGSPLVAVIEGPLCLVSS